jgi:diguanylate cyclase (GGDEF)-like protein
LLTPLSVAAMPAPLDDSLAPAEIWRQAFTHYDMGEPQAARLRAQHLRAVVRLTPGMMSANLVSAAMVVAVVGGRGGGALLLWALAMLLLVGVGWLGARQIWRAPPREEASLRGLHRAERHAAVLGGLWGLMPALWYPGAVPSEQTLLACIVTGMLACGAFVLAPIPRASLLFIVTILVGSLSALARDASSVAPGLAVMILCFSGAVAAGTLDLARRANALLRARLEQAREREWVTLLLHDFEQHAADALWECDDRGRLTHGSDRLAQIMDLPPGQLPGLDLLAWLAERVTDPAALGRLRSARAAVRDLRLPLQGRTPADSERWWSVTARPLPAAPGQPPGHIPGWRGVVRDVSDAVRVESHLHRLAHTDTLTGAASRYTFRKTVEEALAAGQPATLMAIDLDRFKGVNDQHGHAIGDLVLVEVARRLRQTVRPADLLGRLGGDEFALWLPGRLPVAEVEAVARRIVHALGQPLAAGGQTLQIGASVGVAPWGPGAATLDELFVQADLAMYEAKAAGRGRHAVFGAPLQERARRQLALESALRGAHLRGEMTLHFQPRVALASGAIVGAEGLLRWRHPQLGAVAPSEFIPVAERSGSILELGRFALDQACQAAAQRPDWVFGVNVSALQLADEGFVGAVAQALARHALPPAALELEFTESVLIGDAELALARLQALRGLGVRLALDDFGTGYSSLSYLRRFPFQVLKVDRSFVVEAADCADALSIVQTVTALARRLRMRVIAEGIETPAQHRLLLEMGCEEGQGWLFARAMPLHELLQRPASIAAPGSPH